VRLLQHQPQQGHGDNTQWRESISEQATLDDQPLNETGPEICTGEAGQQLP
jgi:hypothetical protein